MSQYQEIDPAVIQAAKTDEQAFIQLYSHYGQRVLRFLITRTGNVQLAEDLTQETFITVLSQLGGYRETGAHFSSWLLQIALNHLRMYVRKKGNLPVDELSELIEVLPEGKTHHTEWIDFFLALQKLSEEDQTILNLKFVEDVSNQEIAEVLGISPNTCAVQIHRALKQLQQHL